MLDTPPRESEIQSWLYVTAGALAIFITIPIARGLRELIREHVGITFFLYIAFALIIIAGYLAAKNLRKRDIPLNAKVLLLVIFFAFISYVYSLRAIPEEAIHVTEYGAIGLLVYRALTHRMRDIGIYLAASLIVGMIGIIDEYIQWLIPSRVFDFRDIRTNFIAGALTQVAIAVGLRPRLIRGLPSNKNWSRICYISSAVLLLLALGFINTPQRIAWYSTKIPVLSYLMDSKSMMVEYGYRFDDPEIGIFRSRFALEELLEMDRKRGDIVRGALDKYIKGEGYKAFQSIYTVVRDPHTHEAGVHLFRREVYFDLGHNKPQREAEYFLIADRENRILTKYFSNSIENSKHKWREDIESEIRMKASKGIPYESKVSKNLITKYNEKQINYFFVTLILFFVIFGVYFGKISESSHRQKYE